MATALSCVDSNSHRFSSVTGPAIRKLSLSEFRNYKRLKLELSREPIVLTGENGAGKTNLIEAVSFLAPGRGIRKARLSEIDMVLEKKQEQVSGVIERGLASWAVSVDLESKNDRLVIGTGRDEKAAVVGSDKRIVRINGHQVKSHSILSNYLSISWLTPQMDRLFLDGPSQRRRFLDRLVFAFDPKHSSRVNSYTHALRERNSLIRSGSTDDAWYLALETKIAEMGVAVVAARRELVFRLIPSARRSFGPFPGAVLKISGDLECWLNTSSALEVEDRYKKALRLARKSRRREPLLIPGPHRSDLVVFHSINNMPANQCSTGEQKALLIAIMVSHANLRKIEFGEAPVMLLDEITAHLDSQRRDALFNVLGSLGSQIWMTGTDVSLFKSLEPRAQFFRISDGAIC
ncbi:MAG: DNA replication/repair protein RecF [Rhodospirillaceae bacterium]|jgi:DNA replication and repair protein RecF|nr:DNA replication/repair protein RecF [Rhodospirillaceae bacterium]